MTKRNADNERIKKTYFFHKTQTDGMSEKTIRQVEASILRFEKFTRYADFKTFSQGQAVDFKEHMMGLDLAPATITASIKRLQTFFNWLTLQPGYKSRVRKKDTDYFNLPDNFIRTASAGSTREFPTLEMVERVIDIMPSDSVIEKRNRAMVAFTAMTAIRVSAIASLKLKHFIENRLYVFQDPREVKTKRGKRIDTFLLPIGPNFETIFLDWVKYLREELLFADHNPLFPATESGHDENMCFTPVGLAKEHWQTTTPIRGVFKAAFLAAGINSYCPHSFRHMIISEAYRRQLPINELKAWSQNIGHEDMLLTLTSYGKLPLEEQARLIRNPSDNSIKQELTIEQIEEVIKKHKND